MVYIEILRRIRQEKILLRNRMMKYPDIDLVIIDGRNTAADLCNSRKHGKQKPEYYGNRDGYLSDGYIPE